MQTKLIGLTGPSSFSQDCINVIEEFLDANFVLLYQNNLANLNYWLDKVDGVIISGGVDIHPSVYNQSVWNNFNLSKFDITRDCRELEIVDYCLKKCKPLLGICRGHQLIGIRLGLGFIMDLAGSSYCHQPHRQGISVSPEEPMHSVTILNPEVFAKCYDLSNLVKSERKTINRIMHREYRQKNEELWVNSFHHQAVKFNKKQQYENNGIDVIGVSRIDFEHTPHIIEFMQGNVSNWISVQWHPEWDWKFNVASRIILEKFKSMLGKRLKRVA